MREVCLFAVAFLVACTSIAADELVLQPGPEGKDVLLESHNPDTNYDGTALGFGNYGMGDRETLIEWDISALPAGAVIDDATMELYCWYVSGSPTGDVVFEMCIDSWDEGTVTWNTKPYTTNEDKVTADWPPDGAWYAVDVTAFVDNWYTGTWDNYGMLIAPSTLQPDDTWAKICDSDNADYEQLHPKLTITYSPTAVEGASLGRVKAVFN